jgi:hypothetical protein
MKTVLLFACIVSGGVAKAAPPVASFIFPAGGQRGTKVPVRVGGLFVHDRCGFALDGIGTTTSSELTKGKRIWFEGPIIPLPDSQQAEDYPVDMLGNVTVDAKASLGARRGRIWTSQGVATGPVFVVGDLPEVVEKEIDGEPIPETVTLPITANGRIFPREDIDLWAVKLNQGETLSALATTTRIRSLLAAKLEVTNEQGEVVAEAATRPALGADTSVRFTALKSGVYHVRITDARGQGGPAFVYRLTMTTNPTTDAVFPLGGRRGDTLTLRSAGHSQQDFKVTIPKDAGASWPTWFGLQPMALDTDDLPGYVESPTKPVAVPAVLNGRVEVGELSSWKVLLQKNRKVELELRGKKLGSPLCGIIVVLDPGGKELAREVAADPGSDPTLTIQPPTDGVYTIQISERFKQRGGADFAYRLRVQEAVAAAQDFRLKLATDVLNVPRGSTAKWKVTAERLGGFKGVIDLSVSDLPKGIAVAKASLAAGQNTIELVLKADATAQAAHGEVTITGTSRIGDKTVSRIALPLQGDAAYVAAIVPTPFVIDGEYTMSNAPRGQPYSRKYKLKRNGFEGPIEIRLADRQARHLQGVTGPTVIVPPGQSEFEYSVQLPAWIEIGRTSRTCLMAVGVVKDADGTEHRVTYTTTETNYQLIVVPEPSRLGIDLVKAAVVAEPGATVRVPFHIARAKGLQGEVNVEFIVPEHWRGITAKTVTVAADQTTGELVLQLNPEAVGPFNMPATVRATVGKVVAEAPFELLRKDD